MSIPQALPSQFSREVMGYGTWTVLHSSSLAPGADPTKVLQLVQLTSEVLACPNCRAHFRHILAKNPYDARQLDQEGVALYICRLHNIVNQDLGKEEFVCTMDALKARWAFPPKKS